MPTPAPPTWEMIRTTKLPCLDPEGSFSYCPGYRWHGLYLGLVELGGRLGQNSTSSSDTPVKVVNGEYSGTSYLGDNSNNKITAVGAREISVLSPWLLMARSTPGAIIIKVSWVIIHPEMRVISLRQ